jgi:hypothetical protein
MVDDPKPPKRAWLEGGLLLLSIVCTILAIVLFFSR